ncbi:hypothetical protein, partial [Treponema endosymbiont of Eucomonympha sp.]|uniref:hypothetical protein n=1 Tax=Treponema endosymbiont of Eucomonympha sp. TaxID=1580831 RepID=UPI000A4CE7D8
MDRLFSALVLGIYLASCAPALPPAGSAETGGRNGRASLTGRAAAEKGVLPDIAQEERVLRAWRVKEEARGRALEWTLQEPIPEIIRQYDGLRPAIGFDPESVWRNATPHTYVYQVSRGRIEVPTGTYGGQTVYDVRQVDFLFSKAEVL